MLQINPATKRLFALTPAEPRDLLYWLVGSDPPLNQGFSGFILDLILGIHLPGNHMTLMFPSAEFAEAAILVGLKELPEAAYTSLDGCDFRFYQKDARESDNTARRSVSLPSAQGTATWEEIAKKLLMVYSEPELQLPALLQCKQLWGTSDTLPQLADRVQRIIQRNWRRLSEDNIKEQTMAQMMRHTYLNKFGTHEMIAERLNLPSSTYYR